MAPGGSQISDDVVVRADIDVVYPGARTCSMAVRISGFELRHRHAVIVKVVRIAATKPTSCPQQARRVVPLVAGMADIAMARAARALEEQPAV